ncbi:MAG: MFS transporter, partial [Streptosporangiaceae bacterium]
VSANARLDQTDAAAQALGPAIGGGLVGLLGAPVTIAVDAISYLIDAALSASIQVDEPRPDSRVRNLRAEIRDGLKWTYRHRTLGPLAVSTHVWFLANGAAMTVLSLLACGPSGSLPTHSGCCWRSSVSRAWSARRSRPGSAPGSDQGG